MRFMMLMIPKGYESAAAGTVPDAKHVEAMMKYNESLQKAGVLIALDGLHPPSMGARISFPHGKPKVIDGPFAEAKEVLGGYWMIQVRNKDEAIAWAKRCPASENETIEVRQVMDHSDDLTHAQVIETLLADLRARGVRVAEPSDPLRDEAFIGSLMRTYTIAPETDWLPRAG